MSLKTYQRFLAGKPHSLIQRLTGVVTDNHLKRHAFFAALVGFIQQLHHQRFTHAFTAPVRVNGERRETAAPAAPGDERQRDDLLARKPDATRVQADIFRAETVRKRGAIQLKRHQIAIKTAAQY